MKTFEPLFAGCYYIAAFLSPFIISEFGLWWQIIVLNVIFAIVWFLAYFYFKKREGSLSPWLMFPGALNVILYCIWGVSEKDLNFCIVIFATIVVLLPFITFLPKFHDPKESYLPMRVFGTLFAGTYFASYLLFWGFALAGLGKPIIAINFLFTIVWFLAYFYFKKKEGLLSPWLMIPGIIVVAISVSCMISGIAEARSFSERDLNYIIGIIFFAIATFLPFLTFLPKSKNDADMA